MSSQSQRETLFGSRHTLLVALIFYSLITLVFLGSFWLHPTTTTYPDVSRDNYADYWNLWWFQEAVRTGSNPFYTHLLYFPTGTTLRLLEFGPLYGLFSMPVFFIRNSWPTAVLAHNFWIFATFIVTAISGFAYARAVSGSNRGALLAGFLLSFCAFRFHHLEHLNLLSFYWIPLCALAAHRFSLVNANSRRWSLVALVLCGLGAAATSLTVLTLAGFFLMAWALCVATLDSRQFVRPRAALAVLAFFAGSLPVTGGLLKAIAGTGMASIEATSASVIRFSPDLLGFLSPERSAVLGPIWRGLHITLHGAGGRNMYLGLALLILAVIGIKSAGKRALPLTIVAALAFLASLGPGVWIANRYHALPFTIYGVLQHLPPFSLNRVPERFVLVTLTALTPLAAVGLEKLFASSRTRPWAIGAIALAAVELLPSFVRAVPVIMPEVYTRLREDPKPGAVLELTLEGRFANDFAFHQIEHRRPIMMGPVNRPSGDAVELLDHGRFEERLHDPIAFPGALADLKQLGIGFVIWHREGWNPEEWDIMRAQYAKHAGVAFQSDELIVFDLAESKGG